MFRGWGFLLGEIWVLILLAALLGLFVGWLIWGRRSEVVVDNEQLERVRGELAAARREKDESLARIRSLEAELAACRDAAGAGDAGADANAARIAELEADLAAARADGDAAMKAELDSCQSANADLQARIATLEADLEAARAASADASEASADVARLQGELDACRAARQDGDARIAGLEADLADCRASASSSAAPAAGLAAGLVAGAATASAPADEGPGERPAALDGPRGGQPDDLKRIKGIGPKLEKLCNSLGFYHFDQVAAWTDQEVAWVDQNLEGFKGRVTRDEWVAQAKVLAKE